MSELIRLIHERIDIFESANSPLEQLLSATYLLAVLDCTQLAKLDIRTFEAYRTVARKCITTIILTYQIERIS